APKLLRPLLKKFFLQDILDRYYTFRLVAIDIIANLYKEQRADIIEDCLSFLNSYILENVKFSQIEEITLKEIKSYYEEDKFIWKLFLSVRRLDRWIKTKIFRENYEFILPGNIKR
ncbi:MAG: hypothetical protein KDK36_02050, partial [Leptospiraceae bacterium]|nr:hypothetical protein [Leptospiraceae bacterium]